VNENVAFSVSACTPSSTTPPHLSTPIATDLLTGTQFSILSTTFRHVLTPPLSVFGGHFISINVPY
jgi:hypothetical protein